MPGLILHRLRLLIAAAALCAAPFSARADEVDEVQRLHYAGQSDAALQRADEFLAKHPKDAQMRFLKGVLLADAKRDTEAIALFEKLSQDYPDLAEPYNNVAVLYAAQGDYGKARSTLELALRTNPSYATAHENLGDVYAALAAQSYAQALKLDPANAAVPPKLALVRQLYKRAGGRGALAANPSAAPK